MSETWAEDFERFWPGTSPRFVRDETWRTALRNIARQEKSTEWISDDVENGDCPGDLEAGYDGIIDEARRALAMTDDKYGPKEEIGPFNVDVTIHWRGPEQPKTDPLMPFTLRRGVKSHILVGGISRGDVIVDYGDGNGKGVFCDLDGRGVLNVLRNPKAVPVYRAAVPSAPTPVQVVASHPRSFTVYGLDEHGRLQMEERLEGALSKHKWLRYTRVIDNRGDEVFDVVDILNDLLRKQYDADAQQNVPPLYLEECVKRELAETVAEESLAAKNRLYAKHKRLEELRKEEARRDGVALRSMSHQQVYRIQSRARQEWNVGKCFILAPTRPDILPVMWDKHDYEVRGYDVAPLEDKSW